MKLETFFEHFDLLAEAPNGVQKLRELILDLAVRGKLVPQDANDEPAAVLLERIKAEEKTWMKNKRNNSAKQLSPIELNKVLFKLPKNWVWCHLGQIIQISSGDNLTSSQMVSEGQIPVYGGNGITGYHNEYNIEKKTLVIGRVGYYCGSVHLTSEKAWITDNAFITSFSELNIYIRFLYWLLKSANLQINNNATAQPVISGSKVYPIIIALPPLPEQKRIVTKVDELMKLCDELEARQKKKRETRILINNAALNKLLTADTPETFTKNWQCIGDNFDILYSAPENIGKLRQAILQLAVMGKLVPQDANDEPAAVLLERIKKEKERLIKEGKIKKDNILSPIKDDKIPYDLPIGWAVERLVNLIFSFQNGISTRKSDRGEPIPVLRLADIKVGQQLSEDSLREISLTANEIDKYQVNQGDILVIRVNGSAELVGRFVPCLINKKWAYCDHLIRVRIPLQLLDYRYICLFANTNKARKHLIEQTITTAGQKTINQGGLASLLVCIPPIEEQKRIVSKVDKLMKLCDELETKLTQTQTESEKIINAAVKQLLTV